ncbi:RDD family protein, partial [Myxococcus xanthus]|nr:RDD family protein [Myxococcus xanthus]
MSTARSRVFMTASRQGGRALRLVSGDAQPDSPYPKASLWLRGGARAVDVSVAWGLYVVGGA